MGGITSLPRVCRRRRVSGALFRLRGGIPLGPPVGHSGQFRILSQSQPYGYAAGNGGYGGRRSSGAIAPRPHVGQRTARAGFDPRLRPRGDRIF